jgi:TRAP transporter TAXI family solute receptor
MEGRTSFRRFNMSTLKKHSQFFFMFLAFALSILSGPHASLAVEKKMLSWGTTSSASGLFSNFVAASKTLNEKIPEINITVRTTAGSVHNLQLLEKREVDIAASDTSIIEDAILGQWSFKGKPFSEFRLLYNMLSIPWQFVVSEKSDIRDVYDFKGKTIIVGSTGTEQVALKVIAILGIPAKVRRSSMADSVEAFKNDMADVFVKVGAPDSAILDIISSKKIRILSMGDADIEKITSKHLGFVKELVPSGIYPGVGEFKTIGNLYFNCIRSDFPSELAHKIVKTIFENATEIRKAYPQFMGDRFQDLVNLKIGVLHPGVVKFYREQGYTVPKRLLPPEMGEK